MTNTDDFNPRHRIQVFDAFGTPIVPAPRYSSTEQQLRAEIEAQALVIRELVRALGDVTADMWGNVDAEEVIIHTTDGAKHVNPKTAKAFWVAAALLSKYGDTK